MGLGEARGREAGVQIQGGPGPAGGEPGASRQLRSATRNSSGKASPSQAHGHGAPLGSLKGALGLDKHVPHVRQSYNWDCGLACVLMVLRGLGWDSIDLHKLRSMCPTKSIWTVDLAHLLRSFGLDVQFLTVTIGANPNFANETFYMENMEEDGKRVEKLFRDAPQVGISIEHRSLSLEELLCYVSSGDYLVITLIDKRKLTAMWSTAEVCLGRCCGIGSGYTGHYVVLLGYLKDMNQFIVRDPASTSDTLYIDCASFDMARKAFGTDEDLLIVSAAGKGQRREH